LAIRDAGSPFQCCSPVRFCRSWTLTWLAWRLPAIRGDLAASSSEVQFVISAYAATYAVFLITGGGLGDLFGGGGRFSGGSPDSQSPLCCAVSHGHLASWSAGESFKGLRRRC
jgi:MFS family permease